MLTCKLITVDNIAALHVRPFIERWEMSVFMSGNIEEFQNGWEFSRETLLIFP